MEVYKEIYKEYCGAISTSIITNGTRYFVIDDLKWNGEYYYDCFEIAENLIDIINKDTLYKITPIFLEVEDDDDDFELINFEIEVE